MWWLLQKWVLVKLLMLSIFETFDYFVSWCFYLTKYSCWIEIRECMHGGRKLVWLQPDSGWDQLVPDPHMLVWIDETGCDGRHSTRKYGYSVSGLQQCLSFLLMVSMHDEFIADILQCPTDSRHTKTPKIPKRWSCSFSKYHIYSNSSHGYY